jgi:NADH-quinone oxidoreductase subunit I
MFGSGVLKGLGVTLKEFVATYVDDVKKIPSRYAGGKEELDQTAASAQNGIFTVQYPEERRKLSERFRYIPMLVYDAETGEDRCTACGICAKVCPPQCIWIVRAKDEKGKPIPQPAEFFIDTTICMNCGLCAEFCPFDAIKMNDDYEIAAQQRMPYLVFDLKELRVPTTYYARIKPTDWADEEAARAAKEAEKAAKPERPAKAEAGSSTARAAGAEAAPAPAVDVAPAATVAAAAVVVPPAAGKRTPEEVERLKAEAAARRAAKAAEGGEASEPTPVAAAPVVEAAPAAAVLPAVAGVPAGAGRRTPEEIEQLKAEAAARRAAKASGEAPAAAPAPAAVPEAPSAPVAETAPGELPAVAPVSVPAPEAPAEPVAATTPPEPPATEAVQATPAVTGVGAKRTPEEIERLKAEAAARRAAKAGQ